MDKVKVVSKKKSILISIFWISALFLISIVAGCTNSNITGSTIKEFPVNGNSDINSNNTEVKTDDVDSSSDEGETSKKKFIDPNAHIKRYYLGEISDAIEQTSVDNLGNPVNISYTVTLNEVIVRRTNMDVELHLDIVKETDVTFKTPIGKDFSEIRIFKDGDAEFQTGKKCYKDCSTTIDRDYLPKRTVNDVIALHTFSGINAYTKKSYYFPLEFDKIEFKMFSNKLAENGKREVFVFSVDGGEVEYKP